MSTANKIISKIDRSNLKIWKKVRMAPNEVLKQAKENLKLSSSINYEKGIAWSNGIIGSAYTWISDYEKALSYCYLSIDQLDKCNETKFKSDILYSLSAIFYFLGDYDKQRDYAYQNLENSKAINDNYGIATAYNGIGTSLYSENKFTKAIEILKIAEKFGKKTTSKEILARIYDGIGQSYIGLEDYKKALSYKLRSLKKSEESGFTQVSSFVHEGIGEIYSRLEQYKKALVHFNKALDIREKSKFQQGIALTKLNIAQTLVYCNQRDSSIENFKEVVNIGKKIRSNELLFKAHKGLAELYDSKDTIQKFVLHFKAYHNFKDKFQSESESKKIKAFEIKGKLEQVQKENNELELKNKELKKFFDDIKILSGIGSEITSRLEIESIFTILYERINSLMHAQQVLVGVVNREENKLEFPLAVSKGNRNPYFEYSLTDKDKKLAVYSVVNDEALHLGCFKEEIQDYIPTGKNILKNAAESLIIIPLKIKKKVIGVLLVQSNKKYAFSNHHFNILTSLASYLSIALDNAQLYGGMEKQVKERTIELQTSYQNSELLNKIGQELISTLNFEDVIEHLFENVNRLMDAGVFGIRLLNKEEDQVEYLYEYEKGEKLSNLFIPMSNDNNYSVWCIKNNDSIFITDHENEYHRYVEEIMVVDGDFPHSLMFYPLRDGNEVLGCISIQSFEIGAYNQYHLSIVKALAQYTTIALLNARRYEKMEEEVALRTKEIFISQENTKLLSEIGKEIAAELSSADIISKVYLNVNTIMDASIFSIGIYREEKNDLYFSGAIEEGKKLKDYAYSMDADKTATNCFKSGKEFVINNRSKEFKNYISKNYKVSRGKMPESTIYLPLVSKGTKIGVITVQSLHKNVYSEYHVDMLRSLSVYIASALENANLYESMEKRVNERTKEIEQAYEDTKLLSQISKKIVDSLDIDSVIESVYENVNKLVDAVCFGVGVYEKHTNQLLVPGMIEKGVQLEHMSIDLNGPKRLATICFLEDKEIFISDLFEEYKEYISHAIPPMQGKDAVSIIYLPLHTSEKAIGFLTVQSFTKNAYTQYQLSLLRSLATTIAIAIENATLYANLEEKVKERTLELVKQKEIIEETNKHITASIRYAKRIQDATLPDYKMLGTYLKEAFVLFRPKDIVSGDFYWIERIGNKVLFAVVDCTGHGVPGAFLSLIGHNSLNQIVNELGIVKPSEILKNLNKILHTTLSGKSDGAIRDGMDLAICCLDLETHKLEFSGANNPLYLLINDELTEIKGDKVAIGAGLGKQDFTYTNHTFKMNAGHKIYLFSDGYADQFGGPRGKKLKYSAFKEFLIKIQNEKMKDQRLLLDEKIISWRGDLEQIDDICILGVKI